MRPPPYTVIDGGSTDYTLVEKFTQGTWSVFICTMPSKTGDSQEEHGHRVIDARGKFGEHERSEDLLEATGNSSFLSALPECFYNSIYAKLRA